ncbi:hypothetical protein SUGI_0273130 [Cryptomeria japonica]|uniref:protein PSK SIMULATOR 1 isoform X2 n=1 Tax=Cryptomeria japonica TaxID=3369 RepID=UPI002408AD5E|nr:protein PSK SIMULATOR 1 isoform X2 [Cryptomeria japonica]GLJ16249.1 hypothetical protein SUGI_0273130 [Cryptomeria japonica]
MDHIRRRISKPTKEKSKLTATRMVSEVGSLLGKAGTVGFGKAVEVLDTLGSSMTNLNLSSGFASGATSKGNKIGILAFEVANTIVKGANLKQSLSEENIKLLKEQVLHSEGVLHLVSNDMDELLKIAAADKRNELRVFAGEVVRFGNHCKDPQWHHLDRYFEKLGIELALQKQPKEEVEAVMQQLMTLAQHTAELYHELHALDRFEQDYRRKLHEDESLNSSQRGDSITILRSELKSQRKHVRNLKKKSLWSKNLDEVMEKLVDIVYFLHQEIQENFKEADLESEKFVNKKNPRGSAQRLGPVGLALHYANIVNQIDSLVSRPSSVPPNTRDTLYRGLPPSIRSALRSKLLSEPFKEELTVPQIKAEMEKILTWLVPVATNTTKAHHGFGWVGEWANTGSALDRRLPGHSDFTLIQTFHYAEKEKTENYIFELIVWLHHLVNQARNSINGNKSPIKSPVRSTVTSSNNSVLIPDKPTSIENEHLPAFCELSQEDKDMLKDVNFRKLTPGISKSQEFDSAKVRAAHQAACRLSKSNSHSPTTNTKNEFNGLRQHTTLPTIEFDIDRIQALDVIDRVENLTVL